MSDRELVPTPVQYMHGYHRWRNWNLCVYMCVTVLQYRQAIIMHEIALFIAIIIIIVATENNNDDSGKKYKQHPTHTTLWDKIYVQL